MSSLFQILESAFKLLEENKVIAKAKAAKDLLDALDCEEVRQKISENSETQEHGSITWNRLLIRCHQLLVHAAEQFHAKPNRPAKERQNTCCSLVTLIIRNACSPTEIYVQFEELSPLIKEILSSNVFKDCQNIYLGILLECVVSNRLYRCQMRLENWKDLLNICLTLYEQNHIDKPLVLVLMQKIVLYGCLDCHFHKYIKTLLTFLTELFKDVEKNPTNLSKPAYRLVITVIQQLSTECRKSLCEFTEKNLAVWTSLGGDDERHALLYYTVLLHHPNGCTTSDDMFYARSPDTWRRTMMTIQNSIFRKLPRTLLSSNLLALSAEVLNQLIRDPSFRNIDDSDGGESAFQPKKRKLGPTMSPLDVFDFEHGKHSLEYHWSAIQILTALLSKYPDTLNTEDFSSLMKKTSDFFTEATKEPKIMASLCHLGKELIKIQKMDFFQSESNQKCWDKIFDSILITLGMGQNIVEGHKLLQLLIEFRGVQNVNAFVNLFFTNAISWSMFSIQTLLVLCNHVTIMDETDGNSSRSEESDKKRLIRWCLNIPATKVVNAETVENVSKIITGLILKTWERRLLKVSTWDVVSLRQNNYNLEYVETMEKCHLSLDFRINLFSSGSLENSEIVEQPSKPSISEEHLSLLLEILSQMINFNTTVEDYGSLVCRMTIVAKCLSNILNLEIESVNNLEQLIESFTTNFTHLIGLIAQHHKLSRKDSHILHTIRAFVALYTSKFHPRIGKIILANTSADILKNLFAMLNVIEEDEPQESKDLGIAFYEKIFEVWATTSTTQESAFKEKKFSDFQVVTIGTHQILKAFSLFDADAPMNERQKKVLKNLLRAEVYSSNVLVNLWKSLALLKSILDARKEFFDKELLVDTGNFIIDLFKLWRDDFDGVRGILQVLPNFFDLFIKYSQEYEPFIVILKAIKRPSWRQSFGPAIQVELLSSIHRVMKLEPHLTSTLLTPDELFQYVCSEFYIVRLESLKILHFMFSSEKVSIQLKNTLIKKVEEIELSETNNILKIDSRLRGSFLDDEKLNRTVTAVSVIGAIIHASGIYHPQALTILFKIHMQRSYDITIIKRMLETVMPNKNDRLALINSNLYDLMMCSVQEQVSMGDFWMLTKCSSEMDFYEAYIGTLILIRLETRRLSQIQVLCRTLGMSFEHAVENNFPSILSWLLAVVSKLPPSEQRSYVQNVYNNLRNNSDEFEHVKPFPILLKEKLADVLLDLLQRLHDQEHFRQVFNVSRHFPKMNVPNFNLKTIDGALEKLEICLSGNSKGTLSQYLIVKCPDTVQKILSKLIHNIYDQVMLEYKLKVFHQYSFFIQFLINDISQASFDEMVTFIVRDVTYNLIHLLKNNDELFIDIVLKFLHQFLRALLLSRPDEISKILDYLVTNLIALIQSSKVEKAVSILNFLIVESSESLAEAITTLGAFPNSSEFDDMRVAYNSLKKCARATWTLKDEMEHFLNAGQEKTLSCSVEGLIHLEKQLSEHREDLKSMYNDLEKLRGFAEDCASSTLHKLTYRLIKLTESSDPNIALEASKCLGELGPADLTTMILHPEEGHIQEDGDTMELLTILMIEQLSDYLIVNNLALREAAADALYEIYASPWGQKIIKNYERLLGSDACSNKILIALKNTRPFLIKSSSKPGKSRGFELNGARCAVCLDPRNEMWKGAGASSYTTWIRNITCTVLNCFDNFYNFSLIPVCKLNVEFCEIILPRLFFLLINDEEKLLDDVFNCINRFFEDYFHVTSAMEQSKCSGTLRVEAFSQESVKCMLNVVNFLRIQSNNNYQSKLNYLPIAKAAQYCSAYFTSLLYAELSSESIKKYLGTVPNDISLIDHLCDKKPNEGKSLQEILREAYLQIGDPDSIHGCGSSHLKEQSSRIQHYTQSQQWDIVMAVQDVELSSGGFSSPHSMINALQHTGLNHLLSQFLTTMKKDENLEDYMYETAWRLANWNVPPRHQNSDNDQAVSSNDYEYYHYQSLKCLHETDVSGARGAIEKARLSVINSLRNTSLECSRTIYSKLLKLQMLREVEELNDKRIDEWPIIIANRWQQDLMRINDFSYIEPILSQRIAMLKMKYQSSNDAIVKNSLIDTYLELSKVAQTQGQLYIASRALESLGRTANLSEEAKDQLNYREALLAWTRGDQFLGRELLKNLIKNRNSNSRLLAQSLKLWGNWMMETRSEVPQVIEEHYQKAIEILTSLNDQCSEDLRDSNDARAALAQFADAHYQQTTEFMKAPLFESLKEIAKFRETLPNQLPARNVTGDKHVRSAILKNDKTDKMDVAEYEKIQREQMMYLKLAIENYSVTLISGNENDFLVFRLVSLWFKNMHNPDITKFVNVYLNSIPAYKFIPLIPQLAPHISTEQSTFSQTINCLVRRCAQEHPHHVLSVLMSICNTNKDYEFLKVKETTEPPLRVFAARKIIDELAKTNVKQIIDEMYKTSEALMALAYYQAPKKNAGSSQRIPSQHPILKIHNYDKCMVPTIDLPVQANGKYGNVVGIYKYKDSFEALGGINAPKKIFCIGADGVMRIQVIKVDADIKTDSIMQQVFTVMNSLFQSSIEAKKRKLNIRTYKVVSLSQQSGVLQWCDNTVPMSAVLLGSEGLHAKYYKYDWPAEKCKRMIDAAKNSPNQERLKVYLTCCENVHPALQYFFLENFPSAETWFERRMAFIRSVATTSMVGYILGLGDRHCSNILIDVTTAEVVHIDFGIAFEQGKVLPIPEPVPFRLTRDMEAAMGVSGVEGVMRRSCEETMKVLRDGREMIITLLQVLIYDPLFSWSISPYKAYKMQSTDSDRYSESSFQTVKPTNKMAERALLRIDQKLNGTEEGMKTSIAGQVQRLIQQARDPANLSRIFCGWQAFL